MKQFIGGEKGIRTLGTLLEYTHFPGVRLRPLGHLSVLNYRRHTEDFMPIFRLFSECQVTNNSFIS